MKSRSLRMNGIAARGAKLARNPRAFGASSSVAQSRHSERQQRRAKIKPDLDAFYYLRHFKEMLHFVSAHYPHALGQQDKQFIERFKELPHAAASLYVRMANRKNTLFDPDAMQYEELDDLQAAIDRLLENGFVRYAAAGDIDQWLGLQTRDSVLALLKAELESAEFKRLKAYKLRKVELLSLALKKLSRNAPSVVQGMHGCLVQCHVDTLAYLLFLYFGKQQKGLNAFALRDLGIMSTRRGQRDFKARFESLSAAKTAWFYTQRMHDIDEGEDATLVKLADAVAQWPHDGNTDVDGFRESALYKLGRALERINRPDLALPVYKAACSYPSSERRVRLQWAHVSQHPDEQHPNEQLRAGVEQQLVSMMDNPSCPEELIFAEDFYQRKFHQQRVGLLTQTLRDAEWLRCDESGIGSPEESVAKVLRRRGWAAYHTENSVWSQLFGLLFWDLIYGQASQVLHSPFDRFPQELAQGSFYQNHEDAIEQRLALFDDKVRLKRILLKTVAKHFGHANALVWWRNDFTEWVITLVEHAPAGSLATVLRAMSQDFQRVSKGFPDLMVIAGKGLHFVEVKTEGDQLKRHQLAQMKRLEQAGIHVRIARVEWFVDPEQEYVVVDVETTGGKAAGHRVTEIGAVRVVGGKIVDRFQTLINPGRRIPSHIVKLTGITDDMVADAPVFAEIAAEFKAFLGSAVFVAHNVNFDYGFLKAEYQRLDQTFSYAKLCTVASARKHLPGHSSYSLANLCHVYGISLESHHRALCDAEAAAEILRRINTKREEASGDEAAGRNVQAPSAGDQSAAQVWQQSDFFTR